MPIWNCHSQSFSFVAVQRHENLQYSIPALIAVGMRRCGVIDEASYNLAQVLLKHSAGD
jgi:hypothetical protein